MNCSTVAENCSDTPAATGHRNRVPFWFACCHESLAASVSAIGLKAYDPLQERIANRGGILSLISFGGDGGGLLYSFIFVHVLCNGKCECHAVVTGYCNDSLFMPIWRTCVKICRELDRVGTGRGAWPALTTSLVEYNVNSQAVCYHRCVRFATFLAHLRVNTIINSCCFTWRSPSALFLFSQPLRIQQITSRQRI
jgi:hypothetical protein